MRNKMFGPGKLTHLNACVGNNGFVTNFSYAQGYLEASEILIDQLIKRKNIYIDLLIYPICYSIRHYLELTLKGNIKRIEYLAKITEKQHYNFKFDANQSHDIKKTWNWFKCKSEALDSEFTSINDDINPIIDYVADIDPTGQTFRYPSDNNLKSPRKHLIDTGLINICNIQEYLLKAKEKLDWLGTKLEITINEYSLGTFTTKLSRSQLYEIADILPHHEKWGTPMFNELKKNIKEKYSLSSRDFDRALQKIKEQRSLANKVGFSKELLGIQEADIIFFLNKWAEVNHEIYNEEKKRLNSIKSLSISEALKNVSVPRYAFDNIDVSETHWEKIKNFVTLEKVIGLKTLYNFNKRCHNIKHVEKYEECYEIEQRLDGYSQCCEKDIILKNEYLSLVGKIDLPEKIFLSISQLGGVKLKEKIDFLFHEYVHS